MHSSFRPLPTDHHELAELGTYNLAGILCSMAVPFLSAWIVIITRQVIFFKSLSNYGNCYQPVFIQAKHVHYSILVFW